jgi:hypothetical protein
VSRSTSALIRCTKGSSSLIPLRSCAASGSCGGAAFMAVIAARDLFWGVVCMLRVRDDRKGDSERSDVFYLVQVAAAGTTKAVAPVASMPKAPTRAAAASAAARILIPACVLRWCGMMCD